MRCWSIFAAASLMLAVFGAFLAAAEARPSGKKYSDQYDHMDVEEVLGNERLYKRYKDCLTANGVCPPPGRDLKENLKEVLRTNCELCTDTQKTFLKKGLAFVHKKNPDDVKLLVDLYGGEGDDVEGLLNRVASL